MNSIESLPKIDIAHKKMSTDLILQGINFETTKPNYGGLRYWLVCQVCKRRVRILYQFEGKTICRICTKLPYQLQTINSRSLFYGLLRLDKLAQKLKDATSTKFQLFYKGEFTKRVERILKTQKQIEMYYNILVVNP